MHARWTLLCLLVATPAAAHAQGVAILGKENAVFARELFNGGFTDLAEGVCKAIGKAEQAGQADHYEVIEVRALMLDIDLENASSESDLIKRKDLIAKILHDKEAFIEENPRTQEANEARNNLPDAYRVLGETITAAVQASEDPVAIAALRSEGQAAFSHAEETLKNRKDQFDEQRNAVGADNVYAERQYMLASYNLARTFYFHSLLYPEGDPEKTKLLKRSIKEFEDFGLDFQEQILSYEGFIYSGLCFKDLGKLDDALTSFNDAIALRDTYNKLPDGRFDVDPSAADIISSAVLQKVLLLTKQTKDFAAAAAAAKDFFDTVPDALLTARGLAVLAAQAEAQVAGGDFKSASETAQKLVDLDRDGRWGANGREILSRLISGQGNLGPDRMLRVAESLLQRADWDRALEVCRTARLAAEESDKEANIGAESFLIEGVVYATQGQMHEAAFAFDSGAELYPAGEKAPKALWHAVLCYRDLYKQERRAFYRKRAEERLRQLATKYPRDPNASEAQMIEGQELEDEEQFLKAAEFYDKIQPGAAGYEKGQYSAGSAYFRHARALIAANKADEAKPFLEQAEARLRKTLAEIEKSLAENLNPEVQARLGGLAFAARATLAQIYLTSGVDRPKDVAPLFEDVEERFPGDAEKLAAAWNFRIQALNQLGKLDEAVEMLESLRQKNPEAGGLASAAGVLARALDESASALNEKEHGSARARELWRTAAQYYLLSVRPQVRGTETLQTSNIELVVGRLYVLGMLFNDVPDDLDSFVGWEGKPTDPMLWQETARLNERLLESAPSYRTMIALGRCYGFLGRWKEAADVYGRLFDQEALVDPATQRFNPQVIAAKPQLLAAYLEYGVAEHQAALEDKDKDRFDRARAIFDRVAKNTESDIANSKAWWQAKYYQVRSFMDRGEYEDATTILRDVERRTQDFDQGKFGYKGRFLKLKTELSKKTFGRGTSSKPKEEKK